MTIKKIFFLILVFVLTVSLHGQTRLYEEQMRKNLHALDIAKNKEDLKKTAIEFENIAEHEKKLWLPYYYAGVCNALIAFECKGKEIEDWCNKAERYANKADSLSKQNSEVYVLKSMIAAARILVNKAKGQKYGTLSAKYAVEAIKLNPENPRAYLLKARNVVNTPEAAGGGKKKSVTVFEQALEKYKTYKPESNLHPNWGKNDAEKELQQVKESLSKK